MNDELTEILDAISYLNFKPFEKGNENVVTRYMEEYGNLFTVSYDGNSIIVFAFNNAIEIWDSENDCRIYDEETDEYLESFIECFKRRLNEETIVMRQVSYAMTVF